MYGCMVNSFPMKQKKRRPDQRTPSILYQIEQSKDTKTIPEVSHGWIKLHRDIVKHWIWKDPNYFKAWTCILLEANHAETKVLIKNELIIVKRGQSVNSLKTWVSLFGKGWTVQKIRTFLKLLKDDSMINMEGLRNTTRITVCNYDKYQSQQHTDNTQTTRKQHAANTQPTTNKNEKTLKNEKKGENNTAPLNFELIKKDLLSDVFLAEAATEKKVTKEQFKEFVKAWIDKNKNNIPNYRQHRLKVYLIKDFDFALKNKHLLILSNQKP